MLFVLVEIALRAAPGLIPPVLLLDFNQRLRSRIARRLDLPTRQDVRFLPRDDGGPPDGVRIFVPHARITYDFPDPGITRHRIMDAGGFCNPEGVESGDPRRDLVALGDSFTFCVGVAPEQTWTRRLSGVLGVSAVNLGMPGIGPYESLQILKQYGLERHPRLVVLNIYEGNDLRDTVRMAEHRAARRAGSPAVPEREVEPEKRRRYLGRHSYAYNLVVASIRWVRGEWRGPETSVSAVGEPDFRYRVVGRGGTFEFNPSNMDGGEVRIALRLQSGEVSLDLFREAVAAFGALGHEHRFIPVLAYTPSAHTVYADSVVFRDPKLAELMSWFSRTQRQFLAEEAGRQGMVFVDLTDRLRSAAGTASPDGLLYFPSILHLTERGHREVAEGLAGPIRELLRKGESPVSSASGQDPVH